MWTTFLVALKANLRNRSALFWMTVFPIVLATMFNGLFGRESRSNPRFLFVCVKGVAGIIVKTITHEKIARQKAELFIITIICEICVSTICFCTQA